MEALLLFLLLIVATVGYFLFYLFAKVKRPAVYSGNGDFPKHIVAHCPSLCDVYWPPWWAINRHFITVCRVILQRTPKLVYKREMFTLPDGGQLALDWPDPSHHSIPSLEDTPVLLILAGLTSSSKEIYVQHLVCDGISVGYNPVVMSFRGLSGVLLKTPRAYCANTDDLEPVINHLNQSNPRRPIVAIGVSLGGVVLVQHLRQKGRDSGLSAVATFSSPWRAHISLSALESSVNWLLYNRHLTGLLKSYVERNAKHLLDGGHIDKEEGRQVLEKVRKCSTIKQFDEAITVPMFGYSSIDEYYDNATNADRIHEIKTPLLSVNAINDPFVPWETLPFDEFRANPNTLLIVPAHGGHIGFLQGQLCGISSRARGTWMNKVVREFLTAMKSFNQTK